MTRLTITLPTPITQLPATRRTFSVPHSPCPWVWRCHKCHTVFRFSAALNRCLQCSHRFCTKCISEFDYSGWERWKSYWRPGFGLRNTEMDDGGEEVSLWEDIYRGEIERKQESIWDGFEIVTGEVRKEDINTDEEESATPPTSPSSEGSDGVDDVWEMTQNHLQSTQAANTNLPQEPQSTFSPMAYGEECEPILLPPAPNSTPEGGYRSVQEARMALYPDDENNDYYGTGEEGGTMKDWPGSINLSEVRRAYFFRRIGETAECEGGGGEEGGDGPLWSPGLSPLNFF